MIIFQTILSIQSTVFQNCLFNLDCDTLLPLEISEVQQSLYQPKAEDLCVITMKGMVDFKYYACNDKVSATEYSFDC